MTKQISAASIALVCALFAAQAHAHGQPQEDEMIPVHRMDEFYGKWTKRFYFGNDTWRDGEVVIAPPCSDAYTYRCTGEFFKYEYYGTIYNENATPPCIGAPDGRVSCLFPNDYHVVGTEHYYVIAASLERSPDIEDVPDVPLVRFTAIAFEQDRHQIKIYYCFDYGDKHPKGALKDLQEHWRRDWRTAINRFWKKSPCNPVYAGKVEPYLGGVWRNYYFNTWKNKGATP
jgi:hypothetical protein